MKKRILLCNEASFLGTGFARYGYEVQQRLYKTGKYELAELACSARPDDPRQHNLPWRFYGNNPIKQDEIPKFLSTRSLKYGEWEFQRTVLNFKPHVVWDIRDWWMMEFEERSPARPYYNWVVMPTVDSEPQTDYWLSTFLNADGVLTYTDWGRNVLHNETAGKLQPYGAAPPAADYKLFKPVENKQGFKAKSGLPANALIIGTVMRNQRRKLYPDLIETFSKFLYTAPKYIADKLYLYLHCSWPDKKGWDLPRLIKDNGIAHRTFFTYVCRKCNSVYPSLFQDARAYCRNCGTYEATMPSTLRPTPVEALVQIYNLFDLYVQYSSCEGFGIPQVEAAACGVPIVAIDYSAMSEVTKNLGGTLIPVQRMVRELETHCLKAFPNNESLLSAFNKYFGMPNMTRNTEGFKMRANAMKHYTWDATAKVWEDYFDALPLIDKWDVPARIHIPNLNIPDGLSNDDFVRWCMSNIAGRPDLQYSFVASSLTQNLNFGAVIVPVEGVIGENEGEFGNQKFTRDMLVQHFLQARESFNAFEYARAGGKK